MESEPEIIQQLFETPNENYEYLNTLSFPAKTMAFNRLIKNSFYYITYENVQEGSYSSKKILKLVQIDKDNQNISFRGFLPSYIESLKLLLYIRNDFMK